MYRLHIKGGDDNGKQIDIEVPVSSIEEYLSPRTLDDHKVAIADDKSENSKPTKPIQMQEMLALQRDDLECQNYATTICLSTSPLEFNKDGLLRILG